MDLFYTVTEITVRGETMPFYEFTLLGNFIVGAVVFFGPICLGMTVLEWLRTR